MARSSATATGSTRASCRLTFSARRRTRSRATARSCSSKAHRRSPVAAAALRASGPRTSLCATRPTTRRHRWTARARPLAPVRRRLSGRFKGLLHQQRGAGRQHQHRQRAVRVQHHQRDTQERAGDVGDLAVRGQRHFESAGRRCARRHRDLERRLEGLLRRRRRACRQPERRRPERRRRSARTPVRLRHDGALAASNPTTFIATLSASTTSRVACRTARRTDPGPC